MLTVNNLAQESRNFFWELFDMTNQHKNHKSKKSVFMLGLTSFFNDASSEMIKPILPMFIESLGGNNIVIGLIGGTREFVANIFTVFFGYWSDRIGRRRIFVYLGYFVPTICKFLLAFSKTWVYVLIFASTERIGKGLRSASRDAIIVETTPYKKGFSFGLHRAFDTGGGIIGTLLVLTFVWFFKLNFTQLILIASIISALALIPLTGVEKTSRVKTELSFKTSMRRLHKKLKHFIAIASMFAMANFSYMFFIIKAQTIFPTKLAPIALYLIFNIVYTVAAIPLGILADKIGRKKVIIAGYFLFSFVCLGFTQAETLISMIILFSLYGLVYALIESNQRAFVTDLANEHQKATSLGAFYSVIGIMSLIGNIIAGMLSEYVSIEIMFFYASVASLIAAMLFLFSSTLPIDNR